jgi:hypothetical protein
MDWKGFVVDHVGHFAPHMIVNAVFAILVASLLGYVLGRVGARVDGPAARMLALWSALAALAVAFTRTQLPVAMALVAVVLLVRPIPDERIPRLPLVSAVLLGAGCGSGAALVAAVLMIPVIALLRWVQGGRPDA